MSFDEFDEKNEIEDGDFLDDKRDLEPQGVDPKRGWGYRGVHRAIICGKIGQNPIQKILRNGKTVTIFTVGTGARLFLWRGTLRPESTMATSVVKLKMYLKFTFDVMVAYCGNNCLVISVSWKIRLIKSGDSATNISLDELRKGLFRDDLSSAEGIVVHITLCARSHQSCMIVNGASTSNIFFSSFPTVIKLSSGNYGVGMASDCFFFFVFLSVPW